MRAVIIDDERIARTELIRLLRAHHDIQVVGEAGDAEEARALLADVRPDLMFLDVQMPEETGFDLLETLNEVPAVVFTTAYDEHAVRAFEVNALDYLVKPIEPHRLASTVIKLTGLIRERPAPGKNPMSPELDHVFVRDGENCWFVKLKEIRLFETEGNYTRIHFGSERPLLLRPLNQLEERVAHAGFFRANRQQMVNLDAVEVVEPWFNGGLFIRLQGGHEVVVSRRRATVFRNMMEI